jgi:hypothetical protein
MSANVSRCPSCGFQILEVEGCPSCGKENFKEVMPDEVGAKDPSGGQVPSSGAAGRESAAHFQLKLI